VSEVLVECVPNVSEGRNLTVIERLAEAVRAVDGVWLLDVDPDPDHNRTVLTYVGHPQAVIEAAVRLAAEAARLIDLNRHEGVHPRIGALDVLPFVPLEGITLDGCVEIAVAAGQAIWQRCAIPIYFYGAAARRPDRVSLPAIRRGQFEKLRVEALSCAERAPDLGGPALHPTAGATAVGARHPLIAFNVQLANADLATAQAIARAIRASSGGLPGVQAMGVWLASRAQAQVSTNITDFQRSPLPVVYHAIEREAEARGASVASSEIVGLVPEKALNGVRESDLKLQNFSPDKILERRLRTLRTQ